MKKVCLVLAVVMMGFVSLVSAQKPFAGTIKTHTHIEGTDDPNILSEGEGDASIQIFGNYTKMVRSIQEGFGITSISNGDAKSNIVILDIMGMGKYYIETPAEKILEAQKTVKYDYDKTGEKKTIAGYECEKVVVTITDLETDESRTFVEWVTMGLNVGENINFAETPGLAGYALRSEVKQDIEGTEVTIITEATEIIPNKKLKVVDFMMPADAQDIKSNPQLMKMLGMGGDDEDED
ncbi:MAG: hypothetical protein J6X01_05510 [Bacteroidales bacterium]|nr:hypothetical protein [Bacteroidales bacterium]